MPSRAKQAVAFDETLADSVIGLQGLERASLAARAGVISSASVDHTGMEGRGLQSPTELRNLRLCAKQDSRQCRDEHPGLQESCLGVEDWGLQGPIEFRNLQLCAERELAAGCSTGLSKLRIGLISPAMRAGDYNPTELIDSRLFLKQNSRQFRGSRPGLRESLFSYKSLSVPLFFELAMMRWPKIAKCDRAHEDVSRWPGASWAQRNALFCMSRLV